MTARVYRLVSDSDDAEWTITVKRSHDYDGRPKRPSPPVDDVPADIRAALLAWVGLPPNVPCASFEQTGAAYPSDADNVACRHCGWIRGAHVLPESEKGLDGCWNFQPVNPLSTEMIEPDRQCRNCKRPYREHV